MTTSATEVNELVRKFMATTGAKDYVIQVTHLMAPSEWLVLLKVDGVTKAIRVDGNTQAVVGYF